MLKPNLEELRNSWVWKCPTRRGDSGCRVATACHSGTCAHFAGAKRAVLLTKEASYSARALTNRESVRTVGCGDHLLAGFVAERMAGGTMNVACVRAWL